MRDIIELTVMTIVGIVAGVMMTLHLYNLYTYQQLSEELLYVLCATQEIVDQIECSDPLLLKLQIIGFENSEMCEGYRSSTSAP